jgi:hypothetical protein
MLVAASLALGTAPVDASTFAQEAVADSMLRAGDANTNEGANPILSISGSGHTRIVLDFGLHLIFPSPIQSLVITLTLVANGGNWGPAGRYVSVHPLLADFDEGNGKSWGLPPSGRTRGSDAGVTWNCPSDINIANPVADCADGWSGGEIGPVLDSVLITNATSGLITFDLTDWVNANLNVVLPMRFLIKKDNDGAPGRVDVASREGDTAPLLDGAE